MLPGGEKQAVPALKGDALEDIDKIMTKIIDTCMYV